ncbi:MAG: sugar-binding domain-containing protein [Pseudomonadota bacterium]
MAREPVEDSAAFIVEVCWHYYIIGKTQAEVAAHLGVTRLRVNQAIQKAKALGIVQIQIDSPFTMRFEMQRDLEAAFGLQKALVVPSDEVQYDFHMPVGAGLATYLTERLKVADWRSLGVSWGLTLNNTIQKLPRQSCPDLEVISILGGTSQGAPFNAFGIASGIAGAIGAKYSILTAPIYLAEGIDRDLFLSQAMLREHFDKFHSLDAVLLSCSNVSSKSFLVSHGLPKEMTTERLREAGAIGDVLGQFLDKDGNSISPYIDNRTIGMPLDQVRKVPEKIMAAAGPHKVEILCAAIKRNLVDTLVTDDVTARLLLEKVGFVAQADAAHATR